ncbi:hypothetical protein M9Y10_009270 [Tritrichomonas musculus]|uniref:Exonuclease domain-containing protein n=1 Tax=Tritrichomonas musculus TaxID=1915356 RepID=A0ABR2IP45_9EUKA
MSIETINVEDIIKDSSVIIKTKIPTTDKVVIGPQRLADFVMFIFTKKYFPKWLKISNPQKIKSVNILFLDGLTYSIFNQYKEIMPTFAQIEGNGFPLTVESPAKSGQLVSGIHSFIGKIKTQKAKKIFKSYEEMVCSIDDLYDCGFPLDETPPHHSSKLRCQHFGLEPLTSLDVQEYEKLPEKFDGSLDTIALDCEMIETEFGDECARLSVTKEDGTVVLDQFFKPVGDVIDYRTECSGITPDILKDAKLTSYETVKALSSFASQETIIIGHSLENDFRSMKLIHKRVIDSSIIFNHDCQYPYKPSLAKLYKKYIQKPFRDQPGSHDSIDDARASFELIKHALKVAVHSEKVKPQIPTLFQNLKTSLAQITYFAPYEEVDYNGIDEKVVCMLDDNPDERLQNCLNFINNEKPALALLHFNELSKSENIDDKTVHDIVLKYDQYLKEVLEKILPMSALVVYTGTGNPKRLSVDIKTVDPKFQHPGKDPERKEEFERCRRGICWIYFKDNS